MNMAKALRCWLPNRTEKKEIKKWLVLILNVKIRTALAVITANVMKNISVLKVKKKLKNALLKKQPENAVAKRRLNLAVF